MYARILMLAAALLGSTAAYASTHRPDAYQDLTAVPLKPGQSPRLSNGVGDLSAREGRHKVKLPLQLEGAMEKVKKSKYKPKREAKAKPSQRRKIVKTKKAKSLPRLVKGKKPSRKSSFRVEAVAPAKRAKSNTHPVGFEEDLPMPTARDSSTSGF